MGLRAADPAPRSQQGRTSAARGKTEAQRSVPGCWPSLCFQRRREVEGLFPKGIKLRLSQ